VDFGDIFNKWEQKNKVYDKDADAEGQKTPAPGEMRRRLLHSKPDDEIDIHGLTGEGAWLALEDFFNKSKENGYKKLRIIHGKGNRSQGKAVLGSTVQKFIEQCPFAGENGIEKSSDGGSGATWVLLKG
jgi:DNA-nicking Smr family endonuclease